MKLNANSISELRRIITGVTILDFVMILLMFSLRSIGLAFFTGMSVGLAAVIGTFIAIANHTYLTYTIQEISQMADQQAAQAKFTRCYKIRMIVQIAWVAVCYMLSQLNLVAGVLPMFFPKFVIMFYGSKSKKK